MSDLPIHVFRVATPDGPKDYVALIPPDVAFEKGLPPEAVVGVLLETMEAGNEIRPENFVRNRVFVDFLHSVVARYGPDQPDCLAEAARLGDGWVYVIDQRTPTPSGAVPPEDVIGAFQVANGGVIPGSYEPSPAHRILSANGFLQLSDDLLERLLAELAARDAGP